MKSNYPRLRSIRPTECNPILTVTTIREIAEHNGALGWEGFVDMKGGGFVLMIYPDTYASRPAPRGRDAAMSVTFRSAANALKQHGVISINGPTFLSHLAA